MAVREGKRFGMDDPAVPAQLLEADLHLFPVAVAVTGRGPLKEVEGRWGPGDGDRGRSRGSNRRSAPDVEVEKRSLFWVVEEVLMSRALDLKQKRALSKRGQYTLIQVVGAPPV